MSAFGPDRQIDRRALPAATSDLRGQAILELAGKVSATFDWQRGLALRVADIPTDMLPHAVRSLALQNYVDPAMDEIYVRSMIDNALKIKVQEGTIKGVRFALSLLGMRVTWVQWHEMMPMGPPGTHQVAVYASQHIFPGEPLLNERVWRHAQQMIATVKRHSQDVSVHVGVAAEAHLAWPPPPSRPGRRCGPGSMPGRPIAWPRQ